MTRQPMVNRFSIKGDYPAVAYLCDPFLRRPYNSRRRSREIGLRCMKLQNPPRVHSLQKNIQDTIK